MNAAPEQVPPLEAAAETLTSANDGDFPTFSGWAFQPGWNHEPLLPIRRKEPKDGASEGEPIEPAFVLYNAMVSEREHRPFRTRTRQPYVAVPVEGGIRTFLLDNDLRGDSLGDYAEFVQHQYYVKHGLPPPTQDLRTVRQALRGRALFDNLPPERVLDLYIRFAPPSDGQGCLLDLADGTGRCVAIRRQPWGLFLWRVEAGRVPTFAQKAHAEALPLPLHLPPEEVNEAVRLLWRYVRVSDIRERFLLLVWEILRFWPKAAKPILLVTGPAGSGKTSLSKYAAALSDPSVNSSSSLPQDARSFLHHARSCATIVYDNVKRIPDDIGNELAALVTGNGSNERMLYTDDDEIVSTPSPKHAVIVNAVATPTDADDLLDRAIFVHLSEFSDDDDTRAADLRLSASWKRDHPRILGGLLTLTTAVCDALAEQERSHRDGVAEFRMGEFERIGRAVAQVLGSPPDAFAEAYRANQNSRRAVVSDSGWSRLLEDFVSERLRQVEAAGESQLRFRAADVVTWSNSRPSDGERQFFVRNGVRDAPVAVGMRLERSVRILRERGFHIHFLDVHNTREWIAERCVPAAEAGGGGGWSLGGASILQAPPCDRLSENYQGGGAGGAFS